MSRLDPRTPVIVGVGQLNRREPDSRDPIDLMVDACRVAIDDAGSSGLSHRADLVAVVGGLWSWSDPGRLVADRLGATGSRTLLTTFGGQTPQTLTAALASRIGAGELDVVVICGGEDNHTRHRARRRGRELRRTREAAGVVPSERFGVELVMETDLERSRGITDAAIGYAVIESVLMAVDPAGPGHHLRAMAELWAGFAAVARENPHATDRSGPDAGSILRVTPQNRMVVWPYTKALCANNDVDMAAAVVMCSASAATDLGLPPEGWVFPWAATRADEISPLSARPSLDRSPALARAGHAVLDLTGVSMDDMTHLELYGCFPSVVQITADALGIDRHRPLTTTGGLGFAGAAMNTSTLHGLCGMVEALRREPGTGLLQGNGGHAAHHAFGVYSSDPPPKPFADLEIRPQEAGVVRPVAAADAEGSVLIEGLTVRFDHEGPTRAVVSCLTTDGARAWGSSTDPDVMAKLMAGAIGEMGRLAADGRLAV